MTSTRCPRRLATVCMLLLGSLSLLTPRRVTAQAWNYPSLQLPSASRRDYTAAIVGSAGTSALFQWREGVGDGMHLGVDAGFADPRGANRSLLLFVGGSIGSELLRATAEQPLDVLFTGGIGTAFGGGTTLLRVPVGVSVGHRFALAQSMALTPYVHPRVSMDICTSCGGAKRHESELSLNFDLGLNFEVSPRFAVRLGGSFSGSDLLGNEEAFAVGLNWTPAPLKPK